MSFWIQIPGTEDFPVLPDDDTGYDLINLDLVDSLHLDISDVHSGTITAVKNGEELILMKGQSPDVVFAWTDLCKNIKARAMANNCQERYQKGNFAFHGIPYEDDVIKVVDAFLVRTGNTQTEENMLIEERTLLSAIFGYLCAEMPAQEQDLKRAAELLDKFARKEKIRPGEGMTMADKLFDGLPEEGPYGYAVYHYRIFKEFSEDVQKKVIEDCAERLKAFGFSTMIARAKAIRNPDRKWGDLEPWADWDENDDT